MANIPLFRGVADRTGCSLPALLGWVVDYAVRLCLPPLREGEFGSLTRALS